jgi:hypothetical protein
MRALNKKVAVVVTTGVVVIASAGTAYAYWSTTGSGTASAASSAGGANLTVAQTSTISNMYPGDAPQTLSGTVTNNADNSAYVASVTVSIKSVTPAAGASGGCSAADYALTNAVMPVNKDLLAKGTTAFSGATIQFANSATTNQDGCKGATVTLAYTAG